MATFSVDRVTESSASECELPYWENWHCIDLARCSSVYVWTSNTRYSCLHPGPFQWVPPHQQAFSWGAGGSYFCASYRCRRHPRPEPRRLALSLWKWTAVARSALETPMLPAGCHRSVLSCFGGDEGRWTPHGRGVARTGAGWRTTPPSHHVGVINPCFLRSSARHIRCSSWCPFLRNRIRRHFAENNVSVYAICCTPTRTRWLLNTSVACQCVFQTSHNWRTYICKFSYTTRAIVYRTGTPNLVILNPVQPDARLCPNPSSIPVTSRSQPEVSTCKQGGWQGNARTEGRQESGINVVTRTALCLHDHCSG